MKIKQLVKSVEEWKKRLGLQDWRIVVRFARGNEINGSFGRTKISIALKTAEMSIMCPVDLEAAGAVFGMDIEETVVHELLHLHFEPLVRNVGDGDYLKVVLEQAIEATAIAFVRLKRENS